MIELLEETFRCWILKGTSPSDILCALHNTCAHGEIFEEIGYEVKEKHLRKLFEGFAISLKAFRRIER